MVSIRDGHWIMIMTALWRVLIICVTDQHAISDNPSADAAALYYLQGNENYRNGQITLAIESYTEAVRIDPGLKHAWSNLGHVYLSEGNYGDAVISYLKCVELEPLSARYHYNVAVAFQHNGDYPSAREQYLRSIELDPSDANTNALFNLAGVHQSMGDLSEAMRLYMQVLMIDPLHVEARLNYCNILFSSHHLEVAEGCYLDVLRVDPSYARGLVNLAAFYASFGDPDTDMEAVALYKRALEVDPHDVMALHGLRALLSNDGDDDGVNDDNLSVDHGRMDRKYVQQLFDSYSFHFDQSLELLQYQSHLSVANATVDSIHRTIFSDDGISSLTEGRRFSIVDIGAGTGLVCLPLREGLRRLDWGSSGSSTEVDIIAVDVSTKMLIKAKEKNCYNSTVVSDIEDYFASCEVVADAIVAADVLMYFGDLSPVLRSCFQALSIHGFLIFTVEDLSASAQSVEEDASIGYRLQKSGRFAHTRNYVERSLRAISSGNAGFAVDSVLPIVPRFDKGLPVHGLLIVAQKHPHL